MKIVLFLLTKWLFNFLLEAKEDWFLVIKNIKWILYDGIPRSYSGCPGECYDEFNEFCHAIAEKISI